MSTTNLSWKEALKVVRVGRSIANPNVGFQQQLKDFESSRLQDVSDTKMITWLFYLFCLCSLFFRFLSGHTYPILCLFIFYFSSIYYIFYNFYKNCYN